MKAVMTSDGFLRVERRRNDVLMRARYESRVTATLAFTECSMESMFLSRPQRQSPLRLSRNASARFFAETFCVLLVGNTANNWIDLTERHKPDQFNRCQAQTSDLWRDILELRQRLSEQMTQSREPGTDKWRSKRTCQTIERIAARPTPTSTRPIPATHPIKTDSECYLLERRCN